MAKVELTPEENLLLLQEIEANRAFILLAYQSDPALLKWPTRRSGACSIMFVKQRRKPMTDNNYFVIVTHADHLTEGTKDHAFQSRAQQGSENSPHRRSGAQTGAATLQDLSRHHHRRRVRHSE